MTPITYGIIEETYLLGNDRRTSYGIAAYADATPEGSAVVIASVRDVSCEKQPLAELVRLCNELELSPIQLHEVVEDFLAK